MVSTLASFPYVVLRMHCTRCARKGSYRLARLAARLGPDMPLVDVVYHLSANCDARVNFPFHGVCGARISDWPPDDPGPPGGNVTRLRKAA